MRAFEQEWSQWLGVPHSVFVNSGSSANLITLAALRAALRRRARSSCRPLTWVSDIAAVLHAGLTPVFVDIDPRTLGMDNDAGAREAHAAHARRVPDPRARLQRAVATGCSTSSTTRGIPLIEDVCESHGATFEGRKLGSFGLASNFSFYYAHHMSTIEGGMVSTDDPRALRSCCACCAPTAWCASRAPRERRSAATPRRTRTCTPTSSSRCPASTCAAPRSTP